MPLDDPEDGEQEYEDEPYIQLPPQHYVDSIHRRDRPIPADAELIILDDSDDDEGPRQPEEKRASSQSEFDELQYPDEEVEEDNQNSAQDEKDELITHTVNNTHSLSVPHEVSGEEPLAGPSNGENVSQPCEALQTPDNDLTREQDGKFPYSFSSLNIISISQYVGRGHI